MEKREPENFENKEISWEEKIEKARLLIAELIKKDVRFTTNEIAKFGKELQEKYPDYHDYRLYCVLIGSTPEKKCSKFDFEGDDSVENFLESLKESLGRDKKIK